MIKSTIVRKILGQSIFPYWVTIAAYSSFVLTTIIGAENISTAISSITQYTFAEPSTLLSYIITPILWKAFRTLKSQYEPVERAPRSLIGTFFVGSLLVCIGYFGLAFLYPQGKNYLYIKAFVLIYQKIATVSFIPAMLIGMILLISAVSHIPQFIIPFSIACRSGYALYNTRNESITPKE